MNKYNHTHRHITRKGQNNWNDWELIIMKQCCGRLPKEQIANILTFLGSKRSAKGVIRQANILGRSLKILNHNN